MWTEKDRHEIIEAALGNYVEKRRKKKLSDPVTLAVSHGDDNHADLAPPAKRHCLDSEFDSDSESSSDCDDVSHVEMGNDLHSEEDNLAEADPVDFDFKLT